VLSLLLLALQHVQLHTLPHASAAASLILDTRACYCRSMQMTFKTFAVVLLR
jgi:hypothetical protein